jgi:hypothetical protein
MVVGSDGRYFSRTATEIVVQMAAANGVSDSDPSRAAAPPAHPSPRVSPRPDPTCPGHSLGSPSSLPPPCHLQPARRTRDTSLGQYPRPKSLEEVLLFLGTLFSLSPKSVLNLR